MQPVLSREQSRTFDQRAIERGVPGILLMESAGHGVAQVALDLLKELRASRVLVLCGGGNNGGDGYVVARLLRARGVSVDLRSLVPLEKLSGDALAEARAWYAVSGEPSGGPPTGEELEELLARTDLVVDALLGTGASREVEGPVLEWIEAIERMARPVLAIDVPSGLDADKGRVLGKAVHAHTTVTLGHYKRGLWTTLGQEHVGRLVLSDIGVPGDLFGWGSGAPAAWLLEESDLCRAMSRRSVTTHKGASGRVAVLAGSPGKVGAARLCARGALRAGGGLVTIFARGDAAAQLEVGAFEEMTTRLDAVDPARTLSELAPHVLAVGPGLGLDEDAARIVRAALARAEPVVLDADALHLVALGAITSFGEGPRVLTPHPGEAARLLGISVPELEADRFGAAVTLAERTGAVVVLKGSRSVVAAPGEVPYVCGWGSPVLATGGTGDVLSGVLAALLVHHPPLQAAWLGVALHAQAGELCARGGASLGFAPLAIDRGVLAREVADAVPEVMARLVTRD